MLRFRSKLQRINARPATAGLTSIDQYDIIFFVCLKYIATVEASEHEKNADSSIFLRGEK